MSSRTDDRCIFTSFALRIPSRLGCLVAGHVLQSSGHETFLGFSVPPFLRILMRIRVIFFVSRSSGRLQFCYSPWVQTKFPGIRDICLHYLSQPPFESFPKGPQEQEFIL